MQNIIQQLQTQFPSLQISEVKLPEGHSLNDMLVNYGSGGIQQLLQEAKVASGGFTTAEVINVPEESLSTPETTNKLIVHSQQRISYKGDAGVYSVMGSLTGDLGSLTVTLQLEDPQNRRKHVRKIDLYEHEQILSFCIELNEKHGFNPNLVELDIIELRDLITDYRNKESEKADSLALSIKEKPIITPEKEGAAVQFLKSKDLMKQIDQLIARSGVIGEENNRILLFICSSTYKTSPLHVLVQGSSGSGKSHLINAIKDCLPAEDTINLTRVTSKSFYHYKGDELMNKLIVIQDFDGLDEEAQLAFREAQSAKYLSSSTVFKDKFGNLQSQVKYVSAHFSSMVATTKAEVYYDNMSRSVVIGVDESDEQTRRIISYQNQKIAGLIDLDDEQRARELLRNCLRVLKPAVVINHYADKIELPIEAKMLRRLNEQFQLFVTQVVYLHQFQRQRDDQGRIVASPEDLKVATDLFFDAIWLKVDELDSSTRQFFERMKEHLKKRGQSAQFTQREIRQALNQSKTTCFKHIDELLKLEYISVADGTSNRGYIYKVNEWRPMQELKDKIKKGLYDQIARLEAG